MMRTDKKAWVASLFICLSLFVFFHPLLFMQGTLNHGDYAVQHYPWAQFLAQSLKSFSLPLWNTGMQVGFPLAAEGQLGAFYPIHWLLYFLLPFKFAHNLNILLHFFLGGLFLYLYLRHRKLSFESSLLASVTWMYGSSYLGLGYWFPMVGVMIWMPLAFWVIDGLIKSARIQSVILLGGVFWLQLTSGSLQLAAYAIAFSSLYFVVSLLTVLRRIDVKLLFFFTLGVVIAAGLSSTQIFLSMELSRETMRFSDATVDFAMLGSFSPLALFSFLFPASTAPISGFRLYAGIFPAFLIILSLFSYKRDKALTLICFFFALLALFFSFGKLNPLYVQLVSFFKLYFFRTPAKLTLFVSLFFSMLVGLGYEAYLKQTKRDVAFQFARACFLMLSGIAVGVYLLSSFLLTRFKTFWIGIGETYVDKYIYGKPFHQWPREYYSEKINSIYEALLSAFSWDVYSLASVGIIGVTCLFVYCYPRVNLCHPRSSGDLPRRARNLFIFSFVVLDLFIFSLYSTGLRGNISKFQCDQKHELAQVLKNDTSLYRVYLYAENHDELVKLGLPPNQNIAASLSYVGAYSPLIMKRYSDYLGQLGNYDNSLGYRYTDPAAFQHDFYKLSLANVKYIYAPKLLSHQSLKFHTKTSSNNYVYVNKEVLARTYFMPYASSGAHQWGMVTVQKYEDQSVSLYVHANVPGKVVLSDTFYPGWRGYINDKEVEIVRSNEIFRSVPVNAGKHTIRFEYKPSGIKKGAFISFLTLVLILLLLGFDFFIKPRQAN